MRFIGYYVRLADGKRKCFGCSSAAHKKAIAFAEENGLKVEIGSYRI